MSLPGTVFMYLGDRAGSLLTYIAISLLVFWLLWPKCRQWVVSQKIPGPPGIPITGSSYQLFGNRANSFKVFHNSFKKYGHTFKMWSIINLNVFVSDPDDLKTILTNKNVIERPEIFTRPVAAFIGIGLIAARRSLWQMHRKIINPIFRNDVIKRFLDFFAQNTKILTEKLEEIADGRTVEFSPYIHELTLDTICRTVVGFEGETLPGGAEGVKKFLDEITKGEDTFHTWIINPWLQVPWLQRLFSSSRDMTRLAKCVKSFMDELCPTDGASQTKSQEIPPGTKRLDKLRSGNKADTLVGMANMTSENGHLILSPKDVRHEIPGILLAGMETTASSLLFLFILLGIHEDIQDEISRELDEIFESDQRSVTQQDLPRLKALERAIKECLRLFPTVARIVREIPEDLQLPSGILLPAGCNVVVFPYVTHRSKQYFPDPENFIPDRWLPENRTNLHPFAYIPFGAGPRDCIGRVFAMMYIKVVVCTVLRSFKVTTRHTMQDLERLTIGITLKFDGKHEVQFHKR